MVSGPRVMGKMGRPAESKVMGGQSRLGLLLPLFRAFAGFSDPTGDVFELLLPIMDYNHNSQKKSKYRK